MTSGQDVPGTRASGDAGGPPRRRRWLVLGVVAALVIAAAGAGAYVARQRSLAAMRGTGGRDAWTITRRSRFQLRCLEESALPLPRELAGNVAATQRYCDCLTEELATAFPSFTRASQALAQVESPGADADGQRAAEISRRCLASSR